MTLLDQIDQWCSSEQITSRPDGVGRSLTAADGLALDLTTDPARGCAVLHHRLPGVATSGPGRPDVSALIAEVDAARPGLVELRTDGNDAVITATLFEDGASKHSFVAAVDEVRKARRQLEGTIAAVTARAQAATALADLARDLDVIAPDAAEGAVPEPSVDTATVPHAATPEPMVSAQPGFAAAAAPSAASGPTPASAAAAPPPTPPAAEPRWCYVEAPTEVRDLSGADRVVGALQPGSWYMAQTETGGWVRVAAADGSLDGWAAATSVRYRQAAP